MDSVSVIVAVYNVKKYLNRCVESLTRQTYTNIQIILVDDGSSDGSSDICDLWMKKDRRITVVHKENGGLSDARNAGLKVANGKYIWFVDGDDYVESDAIELLSEPAKRSSADIIIFSNYIVHTNGKREINHLHSPNKTYQGSQIMEELFNKCIGALPSSSSDYDVGFSPWGRLYKKSLLINNNLKFKSERFLIYEDLMFLLDTMPLCKTIVTLDKPLYNYCVNENSLTRKSDPKRFNKIKKQYYYLKHNLPYSSEIFGNRRTSLRFKRTMIGYVRNAITRNVQNNWHAYKETRQICNDEFCQELLQNYPINKLPRKQYIFALLLKYRLTILLLLVVKLHSIKINNGNA